MIELYISPDKSTHQTLKERLEDMALARKVYESTSHQTPRIQDGKKSCKGFAEVMNYLDELEAFRVEWYRCHCD